MTSRKHLVVEGGADARFMRAWLLGLPGGDNVVVTSVDKIDIPDAHLILLGLTIGNRGRVIAVAKSADDGNLDIRCVADRDCNQNVEDHKYTTLLWTDFPALESYALDDAVLERANLLSFRGLLPAGSELLQLLVFPLRELYAVRERNPNLPTPKYSKGFTKKAKLDEFDVTQTVDHAIRDEINKYERSTSPDPRTFAYGHDIGELLLASYGNTLKNKAGLRDLEALESALLSAVQATGKYINEPLFRLLTEWINAS